MHLKAHLTTAILTTLKLAGTSDMIEYTASKEWLERTAERLYLASKGRGYNFMPLSYIIPFSSLRGHRKGKWPRDCAPLEMVASSICSYRTSQLHCNQSTRHATCVLSMAYRIG